MHQRVKLAWLVDLMAERWPQFPRGAPAARSSGNRDQLASPDRATRVRRPDTHDRQLPQLLHTMRARKDVERERAYIPRRPLLRLADRSAVCAHPYFRRLLDRDFNRGDRLLCFFLFFTDAGVYLIFFQRDPMRLIFFFRPSIKLLEQYKSFESPKMILIPRKHSKVYLSDRCLCVM